MSNLDKMSSYGLYLQTVRVEKGISIEKVSAETRIRTEILHAIEAVVGKTTAIFPTTCLSRVS